MVKILKRRCRFVVLVHAGETCIFLFWQSHGRFAGVKIEAPVELRVSNNASCAQSSRLYQKSRHRYNVLVQLFLSDPHPLSLCSFGWMLQPAQESYAVAAFFYCWNRIYVRPALIFCQSHEEFGCCFWFHMAHCCIMPVLIRQKIALRCSVWCATLRWGCSCVCQCRRRRAHREQWKKNRATIYAEWQGICHCLMCEAHAIYIEAYGARIMKSLTVTQSYISIV